MSTKRCKAWVTCRTSSAQMCVFYTYDSAWQSASFSVHKFNVFTRRTNLCSGHLSIKGKVSLFAVSLFSQTDQKPFQAADKENDKNPTCKPLKMQFIINRDPHSHKWNEWKCTGRFLSATRYQTLRYRKGKEKNNRKKQKKQMKK